MSWERRLREMVLAGGALTNVACGGSIERSAFDAGSQSTDARTGQEDATGQDATGQDASDDVPYFNQCCNGNGDPCCYYQYCGGSLTPRCAQELECQDAGRWDPTHLVCEDAGSALDAPGDAPNGAAGLTCTDAIHVSIGQTLSGSTCGGTCSSPLCEGPCQNGGPVAYFYVDAPAGVAIRINSTTVLNVAAYNDCAHAPQQCETMGTTFAPSSTNQRLFAVELGVTCGDYTITVVNQ